MKLAIDAGIDFPWLLYQLTRGRMPAAPSTYKVGVRSRWLLGDVAHLVSILAENHPSPFAPPSRWNTLVEFAKAFDGRTAFDVNRWEDPLPFFEELRKHARFR